MLLPERTHRLQAASVSSSPFAFADEQFTCMPRQPSRATHDRTAAAFASRVRIANRVAGAKPSPDVDCVAERCRESRAGAESDGAACPGCSAGQNERLIRQLDTARYCAESDGPTERVAGGQPTRRRGRLRDAHATPNRLLTIHAAAKYDIIWGAISKPTALFNVPPRTPTVTATAVPTKPPS